jgi:hypothetical protein
MQFFHVSDCQPPSSACACFVNVSFTQVLFSFGSSCRELHSVLSVTRTKTVSPNSCMKDMISSMFFCKIVHQMASCALKSTTEAFLLGTVALLMRDAFGVHE